jgi:hypothetical protein
MATNLGQVVHADLIRLSEPTTAGEKDELLAQVAAVREIAGVIGAVAIEGEDGSDFDLALFFVLNDFTALEPFGTDARYIRFLQAGLAPRLKTFAGADVRLEGEFAGNGTRAACLALAAPPETYDWEIKQRLEGWAAAQGGSSLIGLAVGERQRFRGLAVAFGDEAMRFQRPEPGAVEGVFVSGRARRLG